jgi:hypothetical protein
MPVRTGVDRWHAAGLRSFWRQALEHGIDPLSGARLPERVVMTCAGSFLATTAGQRHAKGALRLQRWANGPHGEAMLEAIASRHTRYLGREDTGRIPLGDDTLDEQLFALAEAAGDSIDEFLRRLQATELKVGAWPVTRSAPPPLSGQPTLAEQCAPWVSAAPATYGWLGAVAPRLPPHARVVTPNDYEPGGPPVGTVWWRLPEGGWAFLAHDYDQSDQSRRDFWADKSRRDFWDNSLHRPALAVLADVPLNVLAISPDFALARSGFLWDDEQRGPQMLARFGITAA